MCCRCLGNHSVPQCHHESRPENNTTWNIMNEQKGQKGKGGKGGGRGGGKAQPKGGGKGWGKRIAPY